MSAQTLYDADGNQTLVKTATGVWTVAYNGENRPVNWTCGTTNIVMTFDYMGRRVEYLETIAGVTNRHERFVHDGYLCVQRLNAVNGKCNAQFIWDPTEPVATRPLFMQDNAANDNGTCGISGRVNGGNMFFTFDGNKNVSELVHFSQAAGIAAHYEYAPFGAVTSVTNTSTLTSRIVSSNPFRFSSEYHDDTLGLIYYNYRHYNPIDGRWLSEDIVFGKNLYAFCDNTAENAIDYLGLDAGPCCENGKMVPRQEVYIINRSGGQPTGLTGGHIDIHLPDLGLVGFFPVIYGRNNGSLHNNGISVPGNLNIGDDWENGLTPRKYRNHPERFGDSENPISTICKLKVCPAQARLMIEKAKKIHENPGIFNTIGRNCATIAAEILKIGNVFASEISGIDNPQNLINQVKELGATCFTGYIWFGSCKDKNKDPNKINVLKWSSNKNNGTFPCNH